MKVLCAILPTFVNVTRLVIGQTKYFSKSEHAFLLHLKNIGEKDETSSYEYAVNTDLRSDPLLKVAI